MSRVVFLNRFFYPDHSATAQILADLAFDLAASGRPVSVIASRQTYDDPLTALAAEEMIRGVNVYRVATTRFGRASLGGRAIDYAAFYASAGRAALALLQKGDILVAKTDPPLISLVAKSVATRRGAHLVNWLQDLYPEVAAELGLRLASGPTGHALVLARDASLRQARANVVLGDGMAGKLIARGISPARIHVIANWADETIQPVSPRDNPLRREWGLEGKFVVGYSGNLGRAHEYETLLSAAEILRAREDIVFLFIGGGHHVGALEKRVCKLGLSQAFRFHSYQPRAALAYSLSVPDVHWISLKPELEGLIVPSKIYGILAAGRPILAVSARNGEMATLVERHHCGFAIEPGNGSAFAQAVLRLARDHDLRWRLGRNARQAQDTYFARHHALRRWSGVLNALG
jgi:colanic acid biosynthesis glycosyl transferase WcaI